MDITPLSVCTWTSASLFCTVSGEAVRRRSKWRQLETLVRSHDILGLQETRRSHSNLGTMSISDHAWYGSFFTFSLASGVSSGGVVLGVAPTILRKFPRIDHAEIVRGQAHMLRCRRAESEEGIALFSLHLEPAAPPEAKRRLIDSVWRLTESSPQCLCLLMCGLNFVHSGDHRIDIRHLEVVPTADPVAAHFERRMRGHAEFEQMGFTHLQLEGCIRLLLFLIDHICAKVMPMGMDLMSIMASTVGDLLLRGSPSDHAAVSVRIACRRLLYPALAEEGRSGRLGAVKSVFCGGWRGGAPRGEQVAARRGVGRGGASRQLCVAEGIFLWGVLRSARKEPAIEEFLCIVGRHGCSGPSAGLLDLARNRIFEATGGRRPRLYNRVAFASHQRSTVSEMRRSVLALVSLATPAAPQ